MKQILVLIILVSMVKPVSSALISVGLEVMDDKAFVSSTVGSLTGSVFSSNGSITAITDLDVSTYIRSSDSGTIGLLIGNAPVYNEAGNDLALFFVGALGTVSVTLNNVTRSYSSQYMYASNGSQYGVLINGTVYGLSVAKINVDDFGLKINDVIGSFRVGLGVNNIMSLVGGYNIQAVCLSQPPLLPCIFSTSAVNFSAQTGLSTGAIFN